jgi:hypothetical protein
VTKFMLHVCLDTMSLVSYEFSCPWTVVSAVMRRQAEFAADMAAFIHALGVKEVGAASGNSPSL